MSNTIKLKRGSGSDPSASDLSVGELAIRTDSGKIFTKKDNGSVAEISGGGGIDDGDKGDITVANGGDTFTIDNGVVTSAKIADGTIVNGDINASAAIAGSKISPTFTSNITVTNASPKIFLTDTNNNDDYEIRNDDGTFTIRNSTDGNDMISVASNNTTTFTGNCDFSAGIDVTGHATVSQSLTVTGTTSLGETVNITGNDPNITFVDSNNNPDFKIFGNAGSLSFVDSTNSATRLEIQASGLVKANNGFEVTGNITGTGNLKIDNINRSLQVGDVSNDNYADLRQISASSYKGFSFQHNNASVLANLQGTTNQYLVLGDNDSNNSGTLFGISIDQGGSIVTRLTLSASGNLDVQNNITLGGTVDGVDIAARDTLFGGLTSSSGVLTNGVTATTQSAGNNTTRVATTAFVSTAIANLVDSAPGTLNTLNELAAALGDDANFSTTVTNSIATKLPLAGGTLTGDLNFGNSDFARFGASNQLTIGFDGNNPLLAYGTGTLFATGSTFRVVNNGVSENIIWAKADAEVELYYNNSLKFETSNTGISVFGAIAVSGTVDGRDIATDGTKLDGIESGATADQTASEILTLLKTVDGAGSGLDADTLDGVQASALVAVGGDTMTGALRVDISSTVDGILGEAYSTYFGLKHADQTLNSEYMILSKNDHTYISATTGNNVYIRAGGNSSANQMIVSTTGTTIGGNSVLTSASSLNASNLGSGTIPSARLSASDLLTLIKTVDGAGSGLDADTLDGISSASFLRSDANDTMTGQLTIQRSADNQLILNRNIASTSNFYSGLQLEIRATSGIAGLSLHRDGNSHVGIYTNTSNRLDFDFNGGDVILNHNAGTIWGSGNDGSGSGLDSDLLDGQEGSYYRNAGNLNAGTLLADRLGTASASESGISVVGNFGQWETHGTYTNFNTEPNYWGWNYVMGNTNGPNTTSSQWYRCRLSLGSNYGKGSSSGDYSLEMALPRSNHSSAGVLHIRTIENGSEGSWTTVGDNASLISTGTLPAARLPNHSASLLTSGTIPAARVPTLNQNTTGSAATLTTARTIAGVSFNGSANISLNNNAITNGAGYITSSDSSITNKLPLAGGTMSGDINLNNNVLYFSDANTSNRDHIWSNDTDNSFNFCHDTTRKGTANSILKAASFQGSGASLTSLNASNISSGTIAAARVATLNQNTTGSSGSCTGNAATATKLATARTIAGVSFDGSANISLNNNAITNGAGYITSADGGNAATLDGIDSSQFARSDANDTLSGIITLSSTSRDCLNFSGNSTDDNRGIAFNGRIALSADYNDGYLRLNQASEFSNGVYTPGVIRADSGFKVHSGSSVVTVINSSAQLIASRLTGALPAIDGSALTGISAGATGGGSDEVFYENGQTVTTNYTITNGKNAMSAGPITINNGVTVTVGSGENLTIV